jgi:asparagine synthase (glutamine-hydrolysing)
MSFDYKLKKFVSDFNGKKRYRNQRWLGAFQNDDRRLLFRDKILKQIGNYNEFENIDNYLDMSDSDDFNDNLALEYQRLYMMDQVLVKVDRASMLNSLEVRSPFLDNRIVDLANHMPNSFKMHWFEKKYILKRLMKDRLPNQILNRKKKGFGMPIAKWMRAELKPYVISNLSKDTLDEIGLFNVDYVQQILMDHMAGNKDNRKQIWTLLMFVLWWKRWFK